ncbi:MAG: sodium:proton exchanger [Bacteroidetes bacterium GWF2_41_61]|nr:MAG: sodium:proton exchanger [Bacteroidetes bacterium GWE2_40_15]OFY33044.1 MAG: sodium:proton exchanger [Bacteroidetes bacterium GWF2_41_61]OFY88715.1 MAG: sodium:proton exchanger [Bacteroidetes bacterium RIFOXYA12_FULL_40_10]HBG24009.1 sodium:proton exchanger [Rikenellaceae bacterium]
MHYLLLLVGFVILIAGADYLVKGASSIAKKLNISDLIIGLTVVSIGTSAPELSVNIMASLEGSAGMAIGNVVGSNIFNFLAIIGIAALIRPINLKSSLIKIEIPYAILASAALLFVTADVLLDGKEGVINRSDGLILLLFFSIFLYYVFLSAKKGEIKEKDATEHLTKTYTVGISLIMIAGGLAALIFGGDIIVDHATILARQWGFSDNLIGLTILAVGTSLPELATSVVAALRGNSDIAIGNVVGSNIFNIFFILGVSSIIFPLPVAPESIADGLVAAAATALVLFFAHRGRGQRIDKLEGLILIASYFFYTIYIILR